MNIERQIEFDKVKEIWSELAITDWAKEKIREKGWFAKYDIVFVSGYRSLIAGRIVFDDYNAADDVDSRE